MADEAIAVSGIASDRPVQTREREGHATENDAVLEEAVRRCAYGHEHWRRTFDWARDDLRFIYDEQWDAQQLQDRQNRPTLTMNLLPQFLHQLTGNARRSKFSIHVQQVSGVNEVVSDRTGNSYERSQVMEGLIRDIEYRSKATDHYVNALQQVAEGGIAWLFVNCELDDMDPFTARLTISHVKDRFAVLIDPLCEKPDYSDARWCSRGAEMPVKEFEARWPDVPVADWKHDMSGMRDGEGVYWHGREGTVQVQDYWWKEPMKRTVVELKRRSEGGLEDRLTLFEDEFKPVFDELRDSGFEETDRRTVESYKVRYMRCTYWEILEGPKDWPSMCLPIVPVTGREVNLDNMRVLIGMFRYAHDSQRMVNYWYSAGTEKIALTPRAPWLATPDQIAGFEDDWQNQYTKNTPVLLYNPVSDEGVPPPSRIDPSSMATGEIQMMAQARMLMQDTMGLHDASLGRRTNEVSGRAIAEREEAAMVSTYQFIDNLGRAVTRVGEILTDMIPRVYTNDMVRRVVLPDDTAIMVDLNHHIVDQETGREFRVFSLDFATYSSRCVIGPSTATQRENFFAFLTEWGRTDPEGVSVLRDMAVENSDAPKARAMAERLKKTLPRHLLSPEDQARIPPPEPGPEEQVKQMEIQARMAEAQAKIAQAEATIQQGQLKVKGEEVKLDYEQEKGMNQLQKEQAENDGERQQREIEGMVKRAVAEALAGR